MSLERLSKFMKSEDLGRLRSLYKQDLEVEQEKGYAAFVRWATGQAFPELLRLLSFMKGKKVTSSGFLFRVGNQKLRAAGHRPMSFDDMFGEHLQDGRHYHTAFLAGFVDGLSDVWYQLKEEHQSPVVAEDVEGQENGKSCWLGW